MKKILALSALLFIAGQTFAVEVSRNSEVPGIGFQLPVTGLLAAQDPLRVQVISQIQALSLPQAGLSMASPGAVESAAIVKGLLEQPALLKAHEAELTQVLGKDHFAALTAQVGNQAALQALTAPAINPADANAVAQVGDKLALVFDGLKAQTASPTTPVHGETDDSKTPATWKLAPNQKIHKSGPGEEAEAIKMLVSSLKIMELPPYQEKFVKGEIKEPAVAWAGLPSIWKLSIFREGGRQDPGNILYVLDSSWYIQKPEADGKNHIYVTKGVYFDATTKQAVLVTYEHPRRTRYFGNWLTMGAFDTPSGVPLEKDLDTPMSSSSRLEQVTNDKLWTRLLLAARGARVPATRAFLLQDHAFIKRGGRIPGTPRVKAGPIPTTRAAVRKAVVEFLEKYKGPEVVVKPSGPRFHSGEGVKFFPRDQVDEIADYVTKLSKHDHMDSQGVVLLEQRLSPPPTYLRLGEAKDYKGGKFVYRDKKKIGVEPLSKDMIASAEHHERKDWNERVYVVRDPQDQPRTVPMTFFRAGTWGLPTSGQPADPRDAAAVVSFDIMRESWIKQYGIMATDAELEEFMRERADIGEKALAAIMGNEKKLPRVEGEPYQAQTDMIGLDLMYQLENGKLVPYVIEVNDHDAAGQHALDLFHPERQGEHSTVWIETMRARAKKDAQQNP